MASIRSQPLSFDSPRVDLVDWSHKVRRYHTFDCPGTVDSNGYVDSNSGIVDGYRKSIAIRRGTRRCAIVVA